MSDFEEYKKQGEPDKQKKAENWGVAIGLQQVDGLLPSKYLIEVAKDNIEGKISIDEAAEQVKQYYKINPAITLKEQGEKEADEVSARIAKILSTHTFSFSPMEYISIHKALFSGIFDDEIAGKLRTYDITKDEPILNGDTVIYGRSDSLKETLDYDFQTEKNFNYMGLSKAEKVTHLAKFISGIWQIHPFGEGNTRATAVFTIKYLYTLGFKTNNDLFEKHSKYFRNALVRANYQNLEKDIPYTMEYFENGTSHSYSVSTPEYNYKTQSVVRNNLHNYFDNMMIAVPWNKLYKAEYIISNNIRFPELKWDDLHFNMEVIMDIERVAVCSSAGYHFFRSRAGSETTTVFDSMLYQKRKEQFEHILRVYRHWNVNSDEILKIIYGYYASRLVQCVQEIAISNNSKEDKKKMISNILNDKLSYKAIRKGKIKSKILSIAVIPMKIKSVTLCIYMGRLIGFVKINMASLFYKIKSKSVNKAKVIN